MVDSYAIRQAVGSTYFQLLHTVQNIQLGDSYAGQAVKIGDIIKSYCIKPATPARPENSTKPALSDTDSNAIDILSLLFIYNCPDLAGTTQNLRGLKLLP